MRRVVTIIAALNSLLIVPVLCVGGVITHACDCAEETCCPPEHDDNGRSGRGHESGCSDDPCSIQIVRTGRQGDIVIAAAQPAYCASIVVNEGEQPLPKTIRADLDKSSRWNDQPYPSSDLPLLI